jgi:hypothetical protein
VCVCECVRERKRESFIRNYPMTVVRVCDAAGVLCYFTLSPPAIACPPGEFGCLAGMVLVALPLCCSGRGLPGPCRREQPRPQRWPRLCLRGGAEELDPQYENLIRDRQVCVHVHVRGRADACVPSPTCGREEEGVVYWYSISNLYTSGYAGW